MYAAIRACKKSWRRSSTIASAVAGELARGEQAGRACGQIAAEPLTGRHGTHAMRDARLRRRQAAFGDVLNHYQATKVGQSGILMGVHPGQALEVTGGLAISSLSKSRRANTRNNLLNLHI